MKVYVVTLEWEYDGAKLIGVSATLDGAKRLAQADTSDLPLGDWRELVGPHVLGRPEPEPSGEWWAKLTHRDGYAITETEVQP